MAEIRYPGRQQLEFWIGELSMPGSMLAPYLPAVDEYWYREMSGIFVRVRMAQDLDLHVQAARIFHDTVKNHHFVDGNKRSGVVMLYLFYLWNGYALLEEGERSGEGVYATCA